jgi:hypothetical protein
VKANIVGLSHIRWEVSQLDMLQKRMVAHRRTNYNLVGEDLVAKNLRERYVIGDGRKMIGNIGNLDEMGE